MSLKRLAVMQPYFFPYLGYFQLLNSVDVFVFYDDVNFIKQGWINRNRLLVGGMDFMFSVPVKSISSFATIQDTLLHENNYGKWRSKFLKTVEQNYVKAPNFEPTFNLINEVLRRDYKSISDLAISSITATAEFLSLNCLYKLSSEDFSITKNLDRADRLIEICKMEDVNKYINPIGGTELYSKEYFAASGIELSFLSTNSDIRYQQFNEDEFVPWLSIIDVLMFNRADKVRGLLQQYTLV